MTSVSGRRVLVTGADGFIGSHLTERLAADGARVRAFCMYNSRGSWGWLDRLAPELRQRVEIVLGDIRDEGQVRAACEEMEVVFHLAALISIPFSYVAPAAYVDTNVRGTLNVLEGVRHAGCARMIQTSTSEVYGTPDSVPIREDHALKGQSPYSASKIGADKMCEAYARSFATPVVILRPFNTYGPRQSSRAVLATILSQLLAGKREIALGSLSPRRDLTFVADSVDGFVRAAGAALDPGEVLHLGTGRTVSIGELFQLCCAALGVEARVATDETRVRPAASEVEVLLSDPAQAKARLGWTPQTSLEEGIRVTARWIEQHLDQYRPDVYAI